MIWLIVIPSPGFASCLITLLSQVKIRSKAAVACSNGAWISRIGNYWVTLLTFAIIQYEYFLIFFRSYVCANKSAILMMYNDIFTNVSNIVRLIDVLTSSEGRYPTLDLCYLWRSDSQTIFRKVQFPYLFHAWVPNLSWFHTFHLKFEGISSGHILWNILTKILRNILAKITKSI